MSISVIFIHPKVTEDHVGLIPAFLDEKDPRPAAEQFNERYAHGGGWRPQGKFKMLDDGSLKYPGDPPFPVLAAILFRDENIYIYQYGYVAIRQKDGSFEVCRMD